MAAAAAQVSRTNEPSPGWRAGAHEEELRQIMEHMPYGVYIVGSKMDSGVNAMMADWVMQVSFKPRLIAVSFENDARTLANIRATGAFTVNFLSEGEEGMRLASHFAQPYFAAKIGGPQAEGVHRKLEGIPHERTASGCPVLSEAIAWLDCRAEQFVAAGDHTLVIGLVTDGRLVKEGNTLNSIFSGWSYSG